MTSRRNRIDKIIITAMDRFVWFVLLIVMSHLVTEYTRVTGYARGKRNEAIHVNDSVLQPIPVQNMVLYPMHEYEHSSYNRSSSSPYIFNTGNEYLNINSFEPNAAFVATGTSTNEGSVATNNEQGFSFFSFRPLIDSIFEIPIYALRAVNNLVARLAGSYRQVTPEATGKAAFVSEIADNESQQLRPLLASNSKVQNMNGSTSSVSLRINTVTEGLTMRKSTRKSTMREEFA